jgi:predicted acylesterase/phospholipase RssA
MDADDAYRLAKELSGVDAHYWARRLLLKMLARPGLERRHRQRLSQGLALATYKDPALLRDHAFDQALKILSGQFDLPSTDDQETLGLVGSIYKRRWHLDGRRQWLERSLHYYRRGLNCGLAGDAGYTAINAAFVLDMLAHVETRTADDPGKPDPGAEAHRTEARRIRKTILAELGDDILAQSETPNGTGDHAGDAQYWPIATLAEVYFGLERFDQAGEQLARAAALPGVADWMYKTTVEQLVQLTQAQLGDGDPERVSRSAQWSALTRLLGNERASAAQTLFSGKVGLALSGGGFRASLYHLGVLARLAELDLLRHVEVLSCVSGGSIVGAHYYLELRRLLQFSPGQENEPGVRGGLGRGDDEITHQDYLELVDKLIEDFLDGVQKNLRVRVLANPWANLKMLFLPTYSRTERLGELYEQHLYSRVRDRPPEDSKCRPGKRWLNDLVIVPPDEDEDFRPDKVNWRRCNKIPQLVLNATSLNTGHVWQFTASWMGESPNIIDRDVDKNPRLRRMYYAEAPEPYRCFRLGHAVAASSCVPGLFEPLELPSLYRDTNVRLVDGGVYDNLGVASLAEQGCSVMIISDASGQLGADDDPAGGILGPLLRSTSVMMGRIRGAEYDDLRGRRRGRLLKGMAYVHLAQGLPSRDLDWNGCPDPGERTAADTGDPNTFYGIRREVQEWLAGMRTDLDSFSDIEAYALMNSGYHAMSQAATGITGFPLRTDQRRPWAFRRLDEPMASDRGAAPGIDAKRLDKHLRAGHLKFFKVWRLSPWLLGSAVLIGLVLTAMLGLWAFRAWQTDPDLSLLSTAPAQAGLAWIEQTLTLRNLATTLGVLVIGYVALTLFGKKVGKRAGQLLKIRSIAQRAAIGLGVGLIGWIAAGLHLWVFDRLFILLGRLRIPRD